MRKNLMAICVIMMCILALAGCTSPAHKLESQENTATEKQELQGTNVTEVHESQDTTGTGKQEGQENTQSTTVPAEQGTQNPSSTATPEPVVIAPLPVTIDMEQLDNCTVAISLEEGDAYVDDTGAMQMDVTVFAYDLYDMVDIALLKEGDIITIREEEISINSLERNENGTVSINGGLDKGGHELRTDDNTVFYEYGYSDVKFYYELGKATVRVSTEFIYTDASDLDKDAVIYYPGDFLTDKAGIDYHFNPNNTTITIRDGFIVEMNRVYAP